MSNATVPVAAVTAETFADQVLAASRERLVLVDFWAAWCGPCKALAPILEHVATAEQERLVVAKVDVDAEPELASRYGIRALPTLALFREGVVVDQLVGLQSAEAIRARVNAVLRTDLPMNSESLLSTPVRFGEVLLPNRVVMAPLTRTRAGAGRVPTELMVEYYVQRATAGLILTEATVVTPQGIGYPDTPGIWTPEQAAGWRRVTDAVRAAGGRIFLQLWHVGRVSHPELLDGASPVAPSALAPEGHVSLLRPKRPYVVPRPLARDEIPALVEAFRRGAEFAHEAGFDGVEIHGANGYLLDQFLQDGSNRRTDDYGGSVENRARLALEVADAAISVWGAGRVGYHIAPRGTSHSMGDSNPAATFGYLARELGRRKLAFLFVRETQEEPRLLPQLKQLFGGPVVANEGLTAAAAEDLLRRGEADAAAWGQWFIANPDLPHRLIHGRPLNEPDRATFYGSGARGYTDYPASHAA